MNKLNTLDDILNNNNGYIRTSEATENGISRTYFMEYVQKRELERVAHGIYLAKDAWADSMYEIQLRYRNAVFSHETALYLHDLAERVPLKYSVTIKTGGYASRLTKENVKVYQVKESLFSVGITECLSPEGNKLLVYDKERTICDILRSKRNIDPPAIAYALRHYVYHTEKDIHKLMTYAEMFSVEKNVTQYMEVLLDGY